MLQPYNVMHKHKFGEPFNFDLITGMGVYEIKGGPIPLMISWGNCVAEKCTLLSLLHVGVSSLAIIFYYLAVVTRSH